MDHMFPYEVGKSGSRKFCYYTLFCFFNLSIVLVPPAFTNNFGPLCYFNVLFKYDKGFV